LVSETSKTQTLLRKLKEQAYHQTPSFFALSTVEDTPGEDKAGEAAVKWQEEEA
jgi:hypothetical protein